MKRLATISAIAMAACLAPSLSQSAEQPTAEFKLEQIRAIIEGYSIPVLDPHAGDFDVPVHPSRVDDPGDRNSGMTGSDSLQEYRGLLEKDRLQNRSARPRPQR